MIIDFHNHLSPPNSPYRMEADVYLESMDEAGIDKVVIIGKDYEELMRTWPRQKQKAN